MKRVRLAGDPHKPPLKWAGGKRWLVARLRRVFQQHASHRLVEPFCGGIAVALGLSPHCALLNDINPHAINFYRHLQRRLRIAIAMRNDESLYYAHRDEFNRLITGRGVHTSKAAQLFYYLNRTGYNGLCRFNSRGEFNVPFGRYRRINYVRDFSPYVATLDGWDFHCGDFAELELRPNDFIYADPPYDVSFRHYSRQGFAFPEQERLADWLATHRGPVILSNAATPRVLALYRKHHFDLYQLDAPRSISCTGDRSPAREVVAVRNIPKTLLKSALAG